MVTELGRLREASVARPPSPAAPTLPLPAMVDISVVFASTLRMRSLLESAM
jgi:hypothetical protein